MNKPKIKRLIEAARDKKPAEVTRIAKMIINEKVKFLINQKKTETKVGV